MVSRVVPPGGQAASPIRSASPGHEAAHEPAHTFEPLEMLTAPGGRASLRREPEHRVGQLRPDVEIHPVQRGTTTGTARQMINPVGTLRNRPAAREQADGGGPAIRSLPTSKEADV